MEEGMNRIIRSKSKTFLAFCFCFIFGTSLSSYYSFEPKVIWPVFFAMCFAVAFLILVWKNKRARYLLLFVLFFLFGGFRTVVTIPNCDSDSSLCFYNGNTAEISGFIAAEPNEKIDVTEYVVKVVSVNGKVVAGKLFVRSQPRPLLHYGDRVALKCKPEQPTPLDSFRYDKYLGKQGIWSACYYPNIKKTGEGSGNVFTHSILDFKSKVSDNLRTHWPEPEASLMAGLLYGGKSGLPEGLLQSFSRTGVSHIIAVSGFNITIIILVVMNTLVYAGMYRQKAFYAVVAFTVLFVCFSGLSASALRAALMGITLLVAKQVGRGGSLLNIIVFAAALMQLFNPYLLLWDVGFQLSFLATLGLAYINPKLTTLIPERYTFIGETLTSTMSAIIMTLPLILFQFGTLSIVAPLVNVLVLWIIPYLMLFGASTIFTSFIPPLSAVLSFLSHLGLQYVIMIVQFFGRLSWASANAVIPLWAMVLAYASIIFVLNHKIIFVWVKERSK
jgi:competence protein ComEC